MIKEMGPWNIRRCVWEDMWKVEPVRMQFVLKSTYDLLPIPSNLALWNKKGEAACALCKGYDNLIFYLVSKWH